MQVEKYTEKMARPVNKNCAVLEVLVAIIATVDVVCSIVYACNQLGYKSLYPPCKLFTLLGIVYLAVCLFCVYVGVCCNRASYFFSYTLLLVVRLFVVGYSFMMATSYAVFGDSEQQWTYLNSKCACGWESDYVSASEVDSELLQRMGLGLLYIAWSLLILALISAVTASNSNQVRRRRVEEQV